VLGFREVVFVDFEFSAPPGERPQPVCLVAHELVSGRKIRVFADELTRLDAPPYSTSPDTLFVAYYASAELGCHLTLKWPLPARVLDLYVEFRNQTNGLQPPCGNSLLGAMVYHNLDGIAVAEKQAMRELALRGGPWTAEERSQLLHYCESDVVGLSSLFTRMMPNIDIPRALLRGRYMKAAALMEYTGVPLDIAKLTELRVRWSDLRKRLIARIDSDYGIFEGRTFKAELWARWLAANNIPWPRLPTGALALDDDTFREMARMFPCVAPIRELRFALGQLRLEELTVGADGRNRCLLSAFSARTGRNQPSTSKFIFGPSVWLRSLIRPEPGFGLAYIDWSQQEFGIAAVLSKDPAMMAAYDSGDPYLAFAKQAGVAPAHATKKTHGHVRDQFKTCALGVQYTMGAEALADRIGQPPVFARELLRAHREAYPTFWRWSDAAVDRAMLFGSLPTVFGWTIHTGREANPRSLRNFPMQANGAEMLRLACSIVTEAGIRVCAPVHDAILIEAPIEELDSAVATTQKAMADASAGVLSGFPLRSEAKLVKYPDRFEDERGRRMWNTVQEILTELPPPVHECTPDPCSSATKPVL
jgi:DNA polymerase-1